MTSIKGMQARRPQRAQSVDKMLEPVQHVIDLGSGTKAKARHDKLTHLLRDVIRWYKRNLQYEHAQTLISFRRTLAWTALPEYEWMMELKPDEWQALSRGLRALDTPAGSSMYQWLSNHRMTEYEDGD